MNTKRGLPAGRHRRHHGAEFKAKVVEECTRPGVSMAAVALAHGLNANLLRRWVVETKSIGLKPGPATQCATARIRGTAFDRGSAAAACGRRHPHRATP
jgi:transposase-like protein